MAATGAESSAEARFVQLFDDHAGMLLACFVRRAAQPADAGLEAHAAGDVAAQSAAEAVLNEVPTWPHMVASDPRLEARTGSRRCGATSPPRPKQATTPE